MGRWAHRHSSLPLRRRLISADASRRSTLASICGGAAVRPPRSPMSSSASVREPVAAGQPIARRGTPTSLQHSHALSVRHDVRFDDLRVSASVRGQRFALQHVTLTPAERAPFVAAEFVTPPSALTADLSAAVLDFAIEHEAARPCRQWLSRTSDVRTGGRVLREPGLPRVRRSGNRARAFGVDRRRCRSIAAEGSRAGIRDLVPHAVASRHRVPIAGSNRRSTWAIVRIHGRRRTHRAWHRARAADAAEPCAAGAPVATRSSMPLLRREGLTACRARRRSPRISFPRSSSSDWTVSSWPSRFTPPETTSSPCSIRSRSDHGRTGFAVTAKAELSAQLRPFTRTRERSIVCHRREPVGSHLFRSGISDARPHRPRRTGGAVLKRLLLVALTWAAVTSTVSAQTTPRRIVSLAPSVTEVLFEAGAGALVVGVTSHCRFPAETLSLPKVGGVSDAELRSAAGAQTRSRGHGARTVRPRAAARGAEDPVPAGRPSQP